MFLEFVTKDFDCILVFGPGDAFEENAPVTPSFNTSADGRVQVGRKMALTQVLILCCQVSKSAEGVEATIKDTLDSKAIRWIIAMVGLASNSI